MNKRKSSILVKPVGNTQNIYMIVLDDNSHINNFNFKDDDKKEKANLCG